MHINPIHLSDWHRILFGKSGPLFLPQVVLRAVASYAILLLAMRVAGQLSLFELSVVVTMAGAIGGAARGVKSRFAAASSDYRNYNRAATRTGDRGYQKTRN
jgi:hypothetical protein